MVRSIMVSLPKKPALSRRHAPHETWQKYGGTMSGMSQMCGIGPNKAALEHDPEKWQPVFGKDHAQTKS
jgi:hypothetical protein